MERLIGFDFQLLFVTFLTGINIFVLFFLLSYLLFNPAKEVLKKRRERIAAELDNAANKERTAIALKEEYEKKLSEVKKETELILEEARKKAKIRENDIIAEAKNQANAILERANKEIELEKKKALDDLKTELVNIASQIASKAISSSLDIEIQSKLIDESLEKMEGKIWQS